MGKDRSERGSKNRARENREASNVDLLPPVVTEGSAAIATTLQNAILADTYAYGERLPPERKLAKQFGASRSTIREALRRLEGMKLVYRRIGSGTFVSYRPTPDGQTIAQRTSPIELIEVRLGIEPHMARLAAVHGTAEDLEKMEMVLKQLESITEDQDAFSAADEQFHLRLAECTRNPMMIWVYEYINDVRSQDAWHGMKRKILTPRRIKKYNEQHRQIFESLRTRDGDGASKLIRRHIEQARQDLLGAEARD